MAPAGLANFVHLPEAARQFRLHELIIGGRSFPFPAPPLARRSLGARRITNYTHSPKTHLFN